MRWGDAVGVSTASPRWVRPLSGIVALLGDAVVPFDAAGVDERADDRSATASCRAARSRSRQRRDLRRSAPRRPCHARFLPSAPPIIVAGAEAAATAAGLTLIPDAGLVAENAGLTEWPVPLLGRFDPAFLDVPPEVIQLTMRTNQKYFACVDAADGSLAPAFVCVANLPDRRGGDRRGQREGPRRAA